MTRPNRFADILGAAAGAAFAVLLFLSVSSVDPQIGVTDGELQSWWTDSGNRNAFVASMYMLLIASPLFLLFASRVRTRLRAADVGGWADIVFACGIIVSATLGMCGVLRGVIARSVRFDDEPLPGVDTLRFATSLAYAAWDVVILFTVVLVAVVSVQALATRALPRWLGWLGVPVALISAAMLAVQAGPFSLPLLIVWVLAASGHLVRTPASETAQVTARQPEMSSARA